ncbi:D-tyrosyl-tRNA(Tyr) deacylase [bacterium]|nr:D-tyrosyl-tRNA(Tyr) deacylase [bacterium]
MKAVIQRVKQAQVTIENETYSSINHGILVLFCVEKDDTLEQAQKLAEKILKLRIFEDENFKMNKSVMDVKGEIMVVSQFTLAADCKKGTRPSFDKAAPPDIANNIYEKFVTILQTLGATVKTGQFQAMMDVSLINDGPVTFVLQ